MHTASMPSWYISCSTWLLEPLQTGHVSADCQPVRALPRNAAFINQGANSNSTAKKINRVRRRRTISPLMLVRQFLNFVNPLRYKRIWGASFNIASAVRFQNRSSKFFSIYSSLGFRMEQSFRYRWCQKLQARHDLWLHKGNLALSHNDSSLHTTFLFCPKICHCSVGILAGISKNVQISSAPSWWKVWSGNFDKRNGFQLLKPCPPLRFKLL